MNYQNIFKAMQNVLIGQSRPNLMGNGGFKFSCNFLKHFGALCQKNYSRLSCSTYLAEDMKKTTQISKLFLNIWIFSLVEDAWGIKCF